MKKIFASLAILIITQSCSLDNKTGIWKDASKVQTVKKDDNKDITKLKKNKKFKLRCAFIRDKEAYQKCVGGEINKKLDPDLRDVFVKIKAIDYEKKININSLELSIDIPFNNVNWLQEFGSNSNNVSNFSYINKKEKLFKSSRLSKYFITKNLDYLKPTKPLIIDDNVISFDQNGTIYFYSIKDKKKIWQFNFYKKKYKKFNKSIYLSIDNQYIYAADNLGYMYALDLSSGNLIWAKNFGIPFRSNVKIENEKIYLANQDNILYCVDAIKGELIWQFATSLTFLKTDFINNIIIDNDTNSIIFFNTNGELYSINYINQKINWVINTVNIMANSTVDLLLSVPIILKNDSIYVYNGSYFTSYNKFNGLKNWNTKISLKIKPIATKNNIFLITKKDLLVCLDSSTGNLIWSQNIYKSLDVKKKKINKKFGIANSLIIAQNELVIFTSTGQMLSFDFRGGSLISHKKMTSFGLGTDPIFVKGYLYLFDKNYKLFKFQ